MISIHQVSAIAARSGSSGWIELTFYSKKSLLDVGESAQITIYLADHDQIRAAQLAQAINALFAPEEVVGA